MNKLEQEKANDTCTKIKEILGRIKRYFLDKEAISSFNAKQNACKWLYNYKKKQYLRLKLAERRDK